MRAVKIPAQTASGVHYISFGHKRFEYSSRNKCVNIATELTKNLTSQMLDLNRLLGECYVHYRKVWSLDESMNKATYNLIEQAQYSLELCTGSNAIHHTKNIRLVCSFLIEAFKKCQFFYKTRNHTIELKETEFFIKSIEKIQNEIENISPTDTIAQSVIQEK